MSLFRTIDFTGRPTTLLWKHNDRLQLGNSDNAIVAAPLQAGVGRHKARQTDPSRVPGRVRRDRELESQIQRVWDENFQSYGVRKMWRQLNCEDVAVARCTVVPLTARLGLRGAVRGRQFKTTVPDASLPRPEDRVKRNFVAERPDALWVSDLTYVATWRGFVYMAFVIDAFARRIVGWRGIEHSSHRSCPRCA